MNVAETQTLRPNRLRPAAVRVVAPLAALALLSGCGTSIESKINTDELEASMGNATPAESPALEGQPAGEVVEIAPDTTGVQADNLATFGERIAVQSGDTVYVGTPEQFSEGSQRVLTPGTDCGALSGGSALTVVCADGIVQMGQNDQDFGQAIKVDQQFDLAATTASGLIVAASTTTNEALIIENGEAGEPFQVEYPTDELATTTKTDGSDGIVRINREKTIIQDIELDPARAGAMLRVGLGVGEIASGPDGLYLASDAIGNQLAVYTSNDVVRLHQLAPSAEDPWAVAWDDSTSEALLTSTSTNQLVAYDISSGSPVETERFNTITNAQHLAVVGDTIVVVSASGDGMQLIHH